MQSTLVESVDAEWELWTGIFNSAEVSTPNAHVAQGSTVYTK